MPKVSSVIKSFVTELINKDRKVLNLLAEIDVGESHYIQLKDKKGSKGIDVSQNENIVISINTSPESSIIISKNVQYLVHDYETELTKPLYFKLNVLGNALVPFTRWLSMINQKYDINNDIDHEDMMMLSSIMEQIQDNVYFLTRKTSQAISSVERKLSHGSYRNPMLEPPTVKRYISMKIRRRKSPAKRKSVAKKAKRSMKRSTRRSPKRKSVAKKVKMSMKRSTRRSPKRKSVAKKAKKSVRRSRK